MINSPHRPFLRRLTILILLLGVCVAGCVVLAIIVSRDAQRTVGRLADIELKSAQLARNFRGAVDELHQGLLRLGGDDSSGSAVLVNARRAVLAQWLRERLAAPRGEAERRVIGGLERELGNYFKMLDALAARPEGLNGAIARADIVRFDDMSVRLQNIADDFDAVHDAEARDLLQTSLASVQRLRTLIFGCLALLLVAAAAVGALLYRDLVRPLRTRLIESEELLAKREKLAALGTLAAGVAHEIRNPLTAIKARLFTLRRATPAPEAQEDTAAIANEITRLEAIVRDVLGYARPADPKFAEVELAAWLRELAAFEAPALRACGVEVLVDAPEPARVQADAGQLRQIVLNLMRNAADAIDGRSGRITLYARPPRRGGWGQAREGARFGVSDDGPGIPIADHARLFDPFFTTKAAGTGLGLSIVARLVEAHGGQISFRSAPGAGTTFEVRLPRQPLSGITPAA